MLIIWRVRVDKFREFVFDGQPTWADITDALFNSRVTILCDVARALQTFARSTYEPPEERLKANTIYIFDGPDGRYELTAQEFPLLKTRKSLKADACKS